VGNVKNNVARVVGCEVQCYSICSGNKGILMLKLRIMLVCTLLITGFVTEGYAKKVPRKTLEEIELMEKRRFDSIILNLGAHNYLAFENSVRDLEEMGAAAVPHLVKILRDKSEKPRVHVNTIYALGRLGPKARRAVSAIIPYLRLGNKEEDFKAVSAIALGKIGKGAKDSVSHLVQLLFDVDPWVVKSARIALKRIGTEQAKRAVIDYDRLQGKKSGKNAEH
jgi:hypothetical protein